jgi:tRNA(Ile)-lysidine synthase
VLSAARSSGLLERHGRAVVLVSGGRDSVCLLDVARTLRGPHALLALHVNYGLRPEADDDQAHCERLCRRLGVSLEAVAVRPEERGGGNLQAWARELRYRLAGERVGEGDGVVAVGHTASDQAETVLYRLASSPGRRALLGIPARQGRVVRPLLSVTRAQTARYCAARGLAWREDATNDSGEFARGRVRHDLLPALRALHPAAEENVLRTAELLRAEAGVLDGLVDEALDGSLSIALSRLSALGPALARLVLVRMAEDSAGELVPTAAGRLEDVLALGARGGTSELHVGRGVRAVVEYGQLRMTTALPGAPPGPVALAVPGETRFGSWLLRADRVAGDRVRGRGAGLLDAEAVSAGLRIRPWRRGDRMRPVGLGGSRTLADLFTDRRIPREARRALPVVECNGTIAWVPGVPTDAAFCAREDTPVAVRLTAVRDDAGAGRQ